MLKAALLKHNATDDAERNDVNRMLVLLENEPRCFWRDVFSPGHFTASALVTNKACDKVLLVRHKYIGKWFQFGGHADGNDDLAHMALLEAHEESGFEKEKFRMVLDSILDVDIHGIPANPKKNEPEHEHFDVRFLFELDDTLPLPVNPEGLTVGWFGLEEARGLVEGPAMNRMLDKVAVLKR